MKVKIPPGAHGELPDGRKFVRIGMATPEILAQARSEGWVKVIPAGNVCGTWVTK